MAGDKTYITDDQGKLHRATRVHAVTPTDIVWSSNPNDYSVQVKVGGKWHRAILTMDAGAAQFFDNINIDKGLVIGSDGKTHTALIVKPESTVTLSDIKTDTHGTIAGTTTGETAVSTYSENWSDVKWQDNVNVYKVLVTGSDGKVHTALLTTSAGGGVQVIVLGTSPLVLPDAIANSLSYVKAFGGTEQRNIPQPYTQVNYVTNTAQTAVNTGIMIDFAKNYEFEVECRAVSGSWYILQSRASSSGNITGIHGATSGSTITLVVGNVTVCTSAITRTVGNKLYVKATLNAGTATLYVKDETANTEDTQTGSYGTSQPNPTAAVYLLGNAGGQYVDVNSDIYMARIKENDTVVMDYVPARQVATAGFYDKASGTFKTAETPANLSADGNTVPTPDAPMDIVSNNGVLKLLESATGITTQAGTPTPTNPIPLVSYQNGSLILRSVGEYADSYDATTQNITRRVGVKVFDGTETITGHGTINGLVWMTDNNVLADDTAIGICSHYNFTTAGIVPMPYGNFRFAMQGSNQRIVFKDTVHASGTGTTSANNFKAYLAAQYAAGTPVTVYYPLADETTETAGSFVYADGTVETIWAHGKNLFDINSAALVGVRYTVTAVGNNIEAVAGANTNTSSRISIFIPVSFFKENTTYYFNSKSDTSFDINRCTVGKSTPYSTADSYYYGTISQKENNGYSGSFTITDIAPDQEYVSFFYYLGEQDENTKITISDIQIEQGSTATDYEPYYDGGTATAEMLLKVGDYQDEQEILSGAVTRNVGVKVLDGTEDWGSTSTTGLWLLRNVTATVLPSTCICTHFLGVSTTTSGSDMPDLSIRYGVTGYNNRLYIRHNSLASVGELKQYLADQYAAGTPVIVIYPLATPTTESVTGQTLQVTAGDNVLEITQASLTGLELEAQYIKVV